MDLQLISVFIVQIYYKYTDNNNKKICYEWTCTYLDSSLL